MLLTLQSEIKLFDTVLFFPNYIWWNIVVNLRSGALINRILFEDIALIEDIEYIQRILWQSRDIDFPENLSVPEKFYPVYSGFNAFKDCKKKQARNSKNHLTHDQKFVKVCIEEMLVSTHVSPYYLLVDDCTLQCKSAEHFFT